MPAVKLLKKSALAAEVKLWDTSNSSTPIGFITAERRKQLNDPDYQVLKQTNHLLRHNATIIIPPLTPFLRVSKVLLFPTVTTAALRQSCARMPRAVPCVHSHEQ